MFRKHTRICVLALETGKSLTLYYILSTGCGSWTCCVQRVEWALSARRDISFKRTNERTTLRRCEITVLHARRLIVLLMQIIRLRCKRQRGGRRRGRGRVGSIEKHLRYKIDLRRINRGVSGNPFISYSTCRAAWFIAPAERWLYQDSSESIHTEYYTLHRGKTSGLATTESIMNLPSRKCRSTNYRNSYLICWMYFLFLLIYAILSHIALYPLPTYFRSAVVFVIPFPIIFNMREFWKPRKAT